MGHLAHSENSIAIAAGTMHGSVVTGGIDTTTKVDIGKSLLDMLCLLLRDTVTAPSQ
jgi:hypothetical protein